MSLNEHLTVIVRVPQGVTERDTDPCGVWQIAQPSTFTAACSKRNGPCLSAWQVVQVSHAGCDNDARFSLPCTLWQSVHFIDPSGTRWWNGCANCARSAAWHV